MLEHFQSPLPCLRAGSIGVWLWIGGGSFRGCLRAGSVGVWLWLGGALGALHEQC